MIWVTFASVIWCLAAPSHALNPNFDKETLAIQLVQTVWSLKESVDELIGVILDQVPMNISAPCLDAVKGFMYDLTQRELYAVGMVDAFGKTPSGIMYGHILLFGHFDQCLGIRRINNVTGRPEVVSNYCLVRFSHPEINKRLPAMPAYGACLPLACANPHDAEGFVTGLFRPLRAAQNLTAVQGICVEPLARNVGFWIMFVLITVILGIILLASLVHCCYRRRYHAGLSNGTDQTFTTPVQIYEQQKIVATNGLTVHQHTEIQRKTKFGYANVPIWLQPLLCFHLPTNLRTIGAMANDGEIDFLHGFRVLSMWWIILGHTYYLGMNFVENRISLYQDVSSFGFQIILNAGYAVDGFFLLSGLLITYVLSREMDKNNGRLNWLLVYFHRWWRLTPAYMFIMLVYVYVLPHGVESPFKLLIAKQGAPTEYCKSYWWANILYINNFIPVLKSQQCMNWTWFLALDMQFFVLTPILIFILYKSRAAGFGIISVIVVACVATTMALIGSFGLPIHFRQDPLYTDSGYDKDVDYIYEKPYTRITPFVIGVALGYLFAKSPDYKLPGKGKVIAVCLWVLWFLVIDLLLFGFRLNGWDMNPMATQVMGLGGRVAYGGLQRLGWSLIMAWLLFACNYGYGGYIRTLLALKFWRPLSNLTYGVYLVHLLTLQLYFASQRHMIFYSPLNMATIFLSQVVLSYLVALGLAVMIEVPLLRLERLIVRSSL